VDQERRPSTLARLLPHWSRFWLLVFGLLYIGFCLYLLFEILTGTLAGAAYASAGIGMVLFGLLGIYVARRALRYRIAREIRVGSGRIDVCASRWSAILSPAEVRDVIWLDRNPFYREWPLRLWRDWLRVDASPHAIYLAWSPRPEDVMRELQGSGFTVMDQADHRPRRPAAGNRTDAPLVSARERSTSPDLYNAATLMDIGRVWALRYDGTLDPSDRAEALVAMREAKARDVHAAVVGYYDAGFGSLMSDPDFVEFTSV